MRGSGVDMYGSREAFIGLMNEIKQSLGVVFLESRSTCQISPVDVFPVCEPFGFIGCVTWPEFLRNIYVEQRTINDGTAMYFVKDESFCFKASWIRFDWDQSSNCNIAYQKYYYVGSERFEKPPELTAKFRAVCRFVRKNLKRLDGGVYSLEMKSS
jgi:hypothetical protein